jgi:AcrR family transcriptional regulator
MTTAGPPPAPDAGPRERVLRSAMALICRQGVSGTGLRQVVAHAGAPWGSLQHYFPGGKEQLVREALALAGATASRTVGRLREGGRPVGAVDVLAAMVNAWRRWLTETGFAQGCPVVATVADTAVGSDTVREATAEAFAVWQAAVGSALQEAGVPAARAGRLAVLLISALEGAIVLARSRRSLEPLDDVQAELSPLVEGAVQR